MAVTPVKTTPTFDVSRTYTASEFDDYIKRLQSDPNGEIKFGDKTYKLSDLLSNKNHPMRQLVITEPGTQKANLSPDQLKDAQTKLSNSDSAISHTKAEIEKYKAELQKAPKEQKAEIQNKLKVAEQRLAALQKAQQANIKALEAHGKKKEISQEMYKNAGVNPPSDAKAQATATVKSSSSEHPAQQGAANKNLQGAKAQTGNTGNTMPSGWGSKSMEGPKFSTAAYANSLVLESNITSAWDGIASNQNRGQKLMQLLHYYMRMAMSGDMSAMYEMMKAVLYIISKDKALQQVHMANQLIKLQDDSRKATDKLLNSNADANSTDWAKAVQETKAETESIATSQKLIAQMMEEMAQIVETLTNVVKGALDANGRILRTVSRMN